MTIADLINAHEAPIVAVACIIQIFAAFFVLYATADQRAMTPYFTWLRRWRGPVRSAVRLALCLAWVGVIFGAALSAAGIIGDTFDLAGGTLSQAQNDFGVMVSRLSGAVVLPHITFIVWKFVILWAVCGQRPGEKPNHQWSD